MGAAPVMDVAVRTESPARALMHALHITHAPTKENNGSVQAREGMDGVQGTEGTRCRSSEASAREQLADVII